MTLKKENDEEIFVINGFSMRGMACRGAGHGERACRGCKRRLELMGCTVAEKDATNRVVGGMTTDMNGNFAFKVKNVNNKLVFTFMGYKTQESPIGSQRKFNVKMEDNTMKVSEVVVKAQKRGPDGAFNIPQREVSMAMTTFKMVAMEGVSVAGADDALQGRVAGLDIVVGGSPGSGSQMRIRGTTSITGNSQTFGGGERRAL